MLTLMSRRCAEGALLPTGREYRIKAATNASTVKAQKTICCSGGPAANGDPPKVGVVNASSRFMATSATPPPPVTAHFVAICVSATGLCFVLFLLVLSPSMFSEQHPAQESYVNAFGKCSNMTFRVDLSPRTGDATSFGNRSLSQRDDQTTALPSGHRRLLDTNSDQCGPLPTSDRGKNHAVRSRLKYGYGVV